MWCKNLFWFINFNLSDVFVWILKSNSSNVKVAFKTIKNLMKDINYCSKNFIETSPYCDNPDILCKLNNCDTFYVITT